MWWLPIQNFLYDNWFKIVFVLWLFYFARKCGMGWIKQELDWIKGVFIDDDDNSHPDSPNHKNAILLALVVVFIISFLKKIAYSTSDDIPDIPGGWQLVLLAGLGIAAAKTGAQKLFENKWSNGNANGGDKEPPKP